MTLPSIVIGSPVHGHNLWDREREIRDTWKALETSSVLISSPRRFGKTSIMLNLVDNPQSGWEAHYLDVEWVKGAEDFVAEIIAKLSQERRLRKLLDGVTGALGTAIAKIDELGFADFKISLRESLEEGWQDKGKALISNLEKAEKKHIIIADELPLLVLKIARSKGNGEAEDFLSWLRGLRQMPELRDKVRWIFGGSIGIGKVLQKVGAGSKVINDLQTIRVREFTKEDAVSFVKALIEKELNGKEPPSQVVEEMLNVIGVPIPYFIQILVRESLSEMEREGHEVLSEKVIQRAYEQGVLAGYNRTYFEHYYERLSQYYDPEIARQARELLAALARHGELSKAELWTMYKNRSQGQGLEDDFDYVLADLENDFYVAQDPTSGNYTFGTKVLEDWWQRHHAI